eukprot:7120234-Pyramimonas_sp.AAC.1
MWADLFAELVAKQRAIANAATAMFKAQLKDVKKTCRFLGRVAQSVASEAGAFSMSARPCRNPLAAPQLSILSRDLEVAETRGVRCA